MKCPQCGNEVAPDEAFCGQCGTPIQARPQPHATINTSHPASGVFQPYNASPQNPASIHHENTPRITSAPAQFSPTPSGAPNPQSAPGIAHPYPGDHATPTVMDSSPAQTPGRPNQPPQSGFYRDETEAISLLPQPGPYDEHVYAQPQRPIALPGAPAHPNSQPGYPQAAQPLTSGQARPPGPAAPLGSANYPQTPSVPERSPYGPHQRVKPAINPVALIAILVLIVAIVTISAFGAIYLVRKSPRALDQPTVVAQTTAPASTPPPASPTVAVTPPPDAGFAWCDTTCTSAGFTTEYPLGWKEDLPNGAASFIRFSNPAQPDVYTGFKSLGPSTSDAGALVANDIQTTYGAQPGYTPPTSTATAPIGGDNWVYAIVHYQNGPQLERVEVFSVVHQGSAYTIELQAPESQFDALNQQYFQIMTGRFQFQPVSH